MTPTYEIIQPTTYYAIHDRWVYHTCWVRLPDGTVQLWDIPESPLGAAQ